MSKDIDSTAYVEACTLKSGHCDSINALTFSPDGTRLASGGDDCTVMLWDVNRGESLFRILLKSPVSCILWHPIHVNTLIVGCDDGRIFQLQGFTLENMEQHDVRIGVRSEVHCLAYNVDMRYLAIGIGEEVHVTRERHNHEYGGDLMLPPPGPERESLASEERLRAVSVHFVSNGSQLISSYLSHGIVCYDVKSRKSLWVITPPAATPNIGSSALSSDGSRLAVYNVATGVDLYPLARRKKPIARYPLEKPPISKHRVQVVYIQGDRGIVCGSTDGNVHVWNRASGDLFQILPHDDHIIQTVASAERARYSYIATGTVEKGHSSIIKIWRAKTKGEEQGQPTTLTDAVVDFVENVTQVDGIGRRGAVRCALAIGSALAAGAFVVLLVGLLYVNLPWAHVRTGLRTVAAALSQILRRLYAIMQDMWVALCKDLDRLLQWFSDWLRQKAISWLQLDGGLLIEAELGDVVAPA